MTAEITQSVLPYDRITVRQSYDRRINVLLYDRITRLPKPYYRIIVLLYDNVHFSIIKVLPYTGVLTVLSYTEKM